MVNSRGNITYTLQINIIVPLLNPFYTLLVCIFGHIHVFFLLIPMACILCILFSYGKYNFSLNNCSWNNISTFLSVSQPVQEKENSEFEQILPLVSLPKFILSFLSFYSVLVHHEFPDGPDISLPLSCRIVFCFFFKGRLH